ncbi:hypothetical protein [Natrinema longum]|uniref:Small CPxCG-related zinc finger protein n=1 Tax=Natrinema longum TaxID=370324 RepID=A0A8A2UEK5_9EURY|nr:hypothetical protein [Natrinema longum]MBZ6494853.1 hypothetical protein [Natrinema longum]QSW87027.1 hypothetical protein J0X27_10185 [Natrinema longum]
MSEDDTDESSGLGDLTVDADSIAASNSPAGREPLRCPHCDTLIGLIVSYGPLTHKATPCGCPVSAEFIPGKRSDSR